MLNRFLVCGLVAALLAAAPSTVAASPNVEQLLQQAEALRSKDAGAFARILRQLEQHKADATAQQLERLAYLEMYAHIYAGRYDQVITKASRLIAQSSNIDLKLRASALIINSFAFSQRFSDGLRQIELASEFTKQVDEGEALHHVRFATANLYDRVGQYRLGLRELELLLADSGPVSERNRCFAGQLQLQLLQGLGELPSGDEPILRIINECVSLQEPIVSNFARMLLAREWMAKGRSEDAIAYLQTHLTDAEATRYPPVISEMHSLLGEWLFEQGEIERAEQHAKAAISQGPNTLLPFVTAHYTLYRIAERRNDTAAALNHYRRFSEADRAYLNDVKARALAYQLVNHETQQKTQKIALLSQRNEVLQLQQRVQKQANQNMGLMVVLLAFLLAGLGLWAYRVKRMHVSLRRVAETDALTGISNRHHFTRQAERSLAQCASAGASAALIMFDLDRFKAINDTYGHEAGDWVLKQVAEACAGLCRRIDHFGRIGGEEFAILLHGCELRSAVRLAEDCRVRLNQIDTRPSGHTFSVSASFGVSATTQSGYGLSKLMSHADLMLYRAKREGRDRVRAYTGDLPPASPLPVGLPGKVAAVATADGVVAGSRGHRT